MWTSTGLPVASARLIICRVWFQSFRWYSWNQTGSPRAAVTSSMDVVAGVARTKRCFFAFAARATALSPSGWNALWLPHGHSRIGVSHRAPSIRTDMSTLLVSTSRRTRSWYRSKPSRFARTVPSSSVPVSRYPQCAGNKFLRATGSKSKTSSASFAALIRSGSCASAVNQSRGRSRYARRGLAARKERNARRVVAVTAAIGSHSWGATGLYRRDRRWAGPYRGECRHDDLLCVSEVRIVPRTRSRRSGRMTLCRPGAEAPGRQVAGPPYVGIASATGSRSSVLSSWLPAW